MNSNARIHREFSFILVFYWGALTTQTLRFSFTFET